MMIILFHMMIYGINALDGFLFSESFFCKTALTKKYINQLLQLMYMTLQKGTGSFITAILLTSSFMHFPHQVYSVQIFSWSKMKQGVRIKLKNNFPTVFAFFAPTIFKHDRNLKRRWKLFINKRSQTLISENLMKYILFLK